MKFSTIFAICATAASVAALPNPSPDRALESRGEGAEDVVAIAAEIVDWGINYLKSLSDSDKNARASFTQALVQQLVSQHPDCNIVVVHPKHHYNWTGTQGKDWAHQHQEFDVQLGGTIGYEIYIAHAGEFWLDGDGGYLNWAYQGKVTADGNQNHHLTFTA